MPQAGQTSLSQFVAETWPYAVALLGLLMAMGVAVWWIRTCFVESDDAVDCTDELQELLGDCKDLQSQGGLTEEEYRLIKSRISKG